MEAETDRETLREELFEHVRAAAAAFYAASAGHARAVAEFGEMLDHPDGTRAVLQAARHEREAIRQYNCALKVLSDFLRLDG
jgi:hypothetical protein